MNRYCPCDGHGTDSYCNWVVKMLGRVYDKPGSCFLVEVNSVRLAGLLARDFDWGQKRTSGERATT